MIKYIFSALFFCGTLLGSGGIPFEEQYRDLFDNDHDLRKTFFPIIHGETKPTVYEEMLLSTLRNRETSSVDFRFAAKMISFVVLNKAVSCMPHSVIDIQTPLQWTKGKILNDPVELVTIMRSGDILLDTFLIHFGNSGVSKYLIQRDEETAKAIYKYKKLSKTLGSHATTVILEPMVATGSTLTLVIEDLKANGVREDKIIVASVIASPEAITYLSKRYPQIKLVLCVLDERLNDIKFIVPGLGDFGDRFYGS